MRKTTRETYSRCLMQKGARKNTYYFEKWQKWPLWKVSSRATWSKNGRFWGEIQSAKNMGKTTPGSHSFSLLIENLARKKPFFLKNGNIFKGDKSGHFAKAIIRENGKKCTITKGLKFKVPKACKKRLWNHTPVV